MMAAAAGHVGIIQDLLKAHADATVKNQASDFYLLVLLLLMMLICLTCRCPNPTLQSEYTDTENWKILVVDIALYCYR